jgi:osmotically-inducible protein OsmY
VKSAQLALTVVFASAALPGCVATVVGSGGGRETETQPSATTSEDAAMAAEVKRRLAADSLLATAAISVEVRSGVVTLHGRVATQAQRAAAERAAWATRGVKAVISDLEVQ